ncbi:MAG: tRNA glutamyl-Q(34) synthetase GluQRS [Gammaproteobacteria bacterium]
MSYVGRFAPSPTGPLHLGSIVTAIASFLHARQAGGEWLVRIEDIDPPRELPGAAGDILRTLESFGLEWDRSVLYQSSRQDAYRDTVEQLLANGHAFRCDCSRSTVRAANDADSGRYPGTCRAKHLTAPDTAIRLRVAQSSAICFVDGLQGAQTARLDAIMGDYIVLRRDGLPAYHLAAVLDDTAQGVTTIVRGVDLLDSTAAHVHLQTALKARTPAYWHLPIVVNPLGQKLSKQTGAAAVSAGESRVAVRALELLGLGVPRELMDAPPRSLWQWAVANWQIESLRDRRALTEPTSE